MRRPFPFAVLILAAISPAPSVADCPAAKDESAEATDASNNDRAKFRYAGRTFDEWCEQLLRDLDSKTCIQAMPPLAAFARKGYAEEATAALASLVHDDRLDVAMDAAKTLGQVGSKAVVALIDALSDERPQVRMRAAQSLGRLGNDARPAAKALVDLLEDGQDMVRAAVTQTLVTVAADDEELHPHFERLAVSDEVLVRRAVIDGLKANPPRDGRLLRLLIQAVDDDDGTVRSSAGVALAESAPPERAVIEALKTLLSTNDPQKTWQNTFAALGNPGNTATKVAVLMEVVASPQDFVDLRQQGRLPIAIQWLGKTREGAENTVPVLIAIIEKRVAELDDPACLSAAIDALGRIGPPARHAIPALERWIFEEPLVALGNGDTLEKHARSALRKIASSNAGAPGRK